MNKFGKSKFILLVMLSTFGASPMSVSADHRKTDKLNFATNNIHAKSRSLSNKLSSIFDLFSIFNRGKNTSKKCEKVHVNSDSNKKTDDSTKTKLIDQNITNSNIESKQINKVKLNIPENVSDIEPRIFFDDSVQWNIMVEEDSKKTIENIVNKFSDEVKENFNISDLVNWRNISRYESTGIDDKKQKKFENSKKICKNLTWYLSGKESDKKPESMYYRTVTNFVAWTTKTARDPAEKEGFEKKWLFYDTKNKNVVYVQMYKLNDKKSGRRSVIAHAHIS